MSNISHMMKMKTEENSKVWFSSDFHLGHNKPFVWEKRGHKNVDECTDYIISTLNEKVKPEDKLFFIGDFCLNTKESQFEGYLSRINCQNIYMLWGNHNNPVESVYRREVFAKYGEDIKVTPFRYKNVIFLGDYQELLLDGQILIMMHYPLSVWNFMKEGAFMLCGHSHYSFPATRADAKEGLILDIGWDGNLGPYSFDDIKSVMSKKKIKEVDHHVNEKS
jgi:calcineurin-like phosphoesterase family protein